MTEPASVTQLLIDWSNGDREALEKLIPQVHRELHALAQRYLSRGRRNQTLQATALMNELYLRLIDQRRPVQWEGRSHFFGIAARLMRHILVDYARARHAVKRTTEAAQLSLEHVIALPDNHIEQILEVDDALSRLAETDERKAKVVELRYFGGMTHEEIAAACGLSVKTVKRDLSFSEAWLRRDLRHKQ